MKKFLKWIFGLGCLVALGVGVLFVPAVQKQIILHFVSAQLESFEVDKVTVSLGQMRMEHVHVVEGEIEITAEWVEADVSLLDLVMRKPVVVEELRMAGAGNINGHPIENFVLIARYSDDVVVLNQLVARVYQGELQLAGQLDLPASSGGLFKLSGNVVLTDFPSELFDPGRGAPISGLWSGVGNFTSEAESTDLLIEGLELDLDLTGRNGALQFTRFSKEADSMGNLVSSGMSILGMFIKDPRYEATAALVASLKSIEFAELNLNLKRFADGRLEIEQLHVHGGELMIQGSGFVDSKNWASLGVSPLNMNLAFGTRGKLDESARVLSLVGTQNLDNYSLWENPVPISGSLESVNLDALTDLVGGALGF